jgi:uncharacterized protein
MIHPDTELKYISDLIGYGVFAKKPIPKGTITYVRDSLEIYISPSEFRKHAPAMQAEIEKYSFIDDEGFRIVSWDFAKYVNHSCGCNTMSTGYGFEIAIRDIKAGEQLTDEYGIFNVPYEMECGCGSPDCRKIISKNDFDKYYKAWDEMIMKAFKEFKDVKQPLYQFVEDDVQKAVKEFMANPAKYKTVYELKYRQPVKVRNR